MDLYIKNMIIILYIICNQIVRKERYIAEKFKKVQNE